LGKLLGKWGDSSVIHIKYEGNDYLVDTGFANEADLSPEKLAFNERDLELHFQSQELTFEDIKGIFITHWHSDHFANLRLFPRANIYYYDPEQELNIEPIAKTYHFDNLQPLIRLDTDDYFAGCKLIPTPGHTRLHCSLLVEFMSKAIVIAGDAIVSQSYYDKGKVWPYNAGNLGEATCLKAMEQLVEVAEYIIPGHGHPFQNYQKKI